MNRKRVNKIYRHSQKKYRSYSKRGGFKGLASRSTRSRKPRTKYSYSGKNSLFEPMFVGLGFLPRATRKRFTYTKRDSNLKQFFFGDKKTLVNLEYKYKGEYYTEFEMRDKVYKGYGGNWEDYRDENWNDTHLKK